MSNRWRRDGARFFFDEFKSQSVGRFFFFAHDQSVRLSHSISRDFLSSPSPPSARLNPLHRTYRLRALPSSRTTHILTLEDNLRANIKVLSPAGQWVFNGWRWAPPAAPDWLLARTCCRWTSQSAMAPRCRWRKSVSGLSFSFTTTGWRTKRCWTGGRPYSSTSATRRRLRVSSPPPVHLCFSTCVDTQTPGRSRACALTQSLGFNL